MKFWHNPNFLAIFALIIISILALKDLAKPHFYTSHDGETHVARIAQYYQALSDGQFPPRWAKTLNDNLGSPIFVYIYPLPYFLGSFIHELGASFSTSFEILMALSFMFSAIFAYFWLKEVFQSEKAALVGAIFFTWVPYRFSLVYVRASISESLAYTFLPALLWGLTLLSKKNTPKGVALTAIFFSALLLSQNLVAYMVAPLVISYLTIIAIINKSFKYFLISLLALIWGFLISSFTYIPVIFERDLIRFDELFQMVYNSHFVTVSQLIHSPWDYGFSLPGLNDSMSFQIGLAHILATFLAVMFLLLVLLKKFGKPAKLLYSLITVPQKQDIALSVLFFVTLILTIFFTLETKTTFYFWKFFKPIQFIDIPWRYLGITAISTAFLAGFVIKVSQSRVMLLFLIIAVLVANRNHLRINQQKFLSDDYVINYQGSATQFNEFTPNTRNSIGSTQDFVSRIESIKGNIKIYDLLQKSNQVSFKTQSETPARIQVNLIKFKGWQILQDGQKFTNDLSLVDNSYRFTYRPNVDTSGLYDIIVPAGSHQFLFKYQETPLRTAANIISIVSLTLALLTIVKKQYAKA